MRAATLCVAVVLSSAVLLADDHSIIFDEDVDFSSFKTFTMRDGRITSERPELKFPLVTKTLGAAIRSALQAKGLKEVSDRANLVAEFSVTAVDYAIGPFGRANVIRGDRRGGAGRAGALQADFSEGTLVIDLSHGDSGAMLWRGVYRDTEDTASKLADAFPKNAAKLLSGYPPKKKK